MEKSCNFICLSSINKVLLLLLLNKLYLSCCPRPNQITYFFCYFNLSVLYSVIKHSCSFIKRYRNFHSLIFIYSTLQLLLNRLRCQQNLDIYLIYTNSLYMQICNSSGQNDLYSTLNQRWKWSPRRWIDVEKGLKMQIGLTLLFWRWNNVEIRLPISSTIIQRWIHVETTLRILHMPTSVCCCWTNVRKTTSEQRWY